MIQHLSGICTSSKANLLYEDSNGLYTSAPPLFLSDLANFRLLQSNVSLASGESLGFHANQEQAAIWRGFRAFGVDKKAVQSCKYAD